MAYKTILLCLNEIARLPQLISVARELGIKFGAHIAGLYIIPGVQVYADGGYGTAPIVSDAMRNFYQENLPKVREEFETAMKKDKLSFDLHVVESSIPNILTDAVDNAYDADLIVISNTERDSAFGVESDFAERFVLAAGRPVMILPYKGDVKLKTDQIMIGWNQSRESSRAVFDALPFLKQSKKARIVSVDVAPRGNLPAAGIAETLDRHKVKAEVTDVSSDGMTTGETLLRAAKDYGADILVLGAYGHSRFSELVFGGVTRHVLRNLDRVALMSH
jgi:nucleotide-binding universal stress UspA family protein